MHRSKARLYLPTALAAVAAAAVERAGEKLVGWERTRPEGRRADRSAPGTEWRFGGVAAFAFPKSPHLASGHHNAAPAAFGVDIPFKLSLLLHKSIQLFPVHLIDQGLF